MIRPDYLIEPKGLVWSDPEIGSRENPIVEEADARL